MQTVPPFPKLQKLKTHLLFVPPFFPHGLFFLDRKRVSFSPESNVGRIIVISGGGVELLAPISSPFSFLSLLPHKNLTKSPFT